MNPPAIVIGAGPAGLMAAQRLAENGYGVAVYDAMPTPGRKLLRAGIGGLNLTHSEPLPAFAARFGPACPLFSRLLAEFGPDAVRAWAADLGIPTFVGTSGRVFPADFKAAPLLRSWLRRLRAAGVTLHLRHRWQGWTDDGGLRFATPDGEIAVTARAAVLALGGGSWPQLGADGAWVGQMAARGIAVTPLQPANCGFDVAWSPFFRDRFAGTPVKAVALRFGDATIRGEFVISTYGIEGSAVYALSARLRDAIARDGQAVLRLDLKPDWPAERLTAALSAPRGSRSLSTHLEKTARLKGVAVALLRECAPDAGALSTTLKALPLTLTRPRPLAEAISSAGGVGLDQVDGDLMLTRLPGTFVAGEMLDWEAPTGGYLLTGCLATGHAAGLGAARYLDAVSKPPGN